ncbi:hypothetical protein AKJ18_02415 [Vibrio xuii]|nr:hypothetical protein AKJ18_02415 [Vibrio xuii]
MNIGTRLSRSLLTTLMILFVPFSLYAAPSYKIALATWTGYPENVQGFKDGLAENGINLDNVSFISGQPSSDKQVQEQTILSMSARQVDLVYSLTTPGTIIVKRTFPETTPIVFSIVTYPADSGLIDSFEYSGNNLVGTSNYISLQHYIQLIDTLVPNTKSAAIFHRIGEPNSKIQASNLIRLLKRKNIAVHDIEVNNLQELKQQASLIAPNVDLFITTTDTLLQNGGEEVLITIANQSNIPVLSSNKKGIQQGATFGPVADFYQLGKQSGSLAADILLNGKAPRHLQSSLQEQPTFLINRKSVDRLGIDTEELDSFRFQWY